MKYNVKYLLVGLMFLMVCASKVIGQNKPVAIGQWRIHFPYNHVVSIAETKNKFYAAGIHGMFSLDKADGSTERLSPINGFSGYLVDVMRYDFQSDVLILAYNDCTIEIIKNNRIQKNEDIFRKSIIGEKKINHINIVGNIAYLSTTFGLLELNIERNEIRNSYQNIGPGGTTIPVYSSAILNDSLYLSTNSGIVRGRLASNVNLADFNNWYQSATANRRSRHIASYNQKLYAELDSQLFVYENNSWQLFEPDAKIDITNIDVYHNKLIIGIFSKHIITIDQSNSKSYSGINVLNKCLLDEKGIYWYSSPQNGLVMQHPDGEINYYPNGPSYINSYQMLNAFNQFWVMGGTFRETNYAPNFRLNGYYVFDNFSWRNSDLNTPLLMNTYDYTLASYQKSLNRMFIGTHGSGVVQLNNGIPNKVWNETNSPLKKRGGLYNIITGIASDKNNNLWISNYDVDSTLHQYTNKGNWISYKLPTSKNTKIIIDSRNNKWMSTTGEGVWVFNDNNTLDKSDDIALRINNAKGTGNLPTNNVNDIAFTQSGELLIGTDQGFVRIRTPNNIFSNGNYDAERIIVSVEQGSSLGGYILETERINCIVVDGGNRRWFGTDKGAWLYDKDGTTLLHQFTKANSPLPSDNILSIGIDETTGEVFLGTDQGLVSFRADAQIAAKSFENIKIYPNPVKPDFDGDIAISGLMENTLVKITDINGALVYQTFSNGGMATWNCRTLGGYRPSTGVYLVFCLSSDGKESEVGKILFIH
jgi:ligand-binding sensor domain-containing protein